MACDRMATVIKPALPERADAESGYGEPPCPFLTSSEIDFGNHRS
jgi:hypothetical protein